MKSRFSICYGSAVLGATTYILSAFLAYIPYPLPFSPLDNWLSDLGNQIANPQGAIFYNVGIILTALFLAIWFVAGLSEWKLKYIIAHRRLLAIAQTSGILAAIGLIMSALYPINISQVHSFWSQVHFMMFGIGFGFSAAALRYHPSFSKEFLYIGAGASALPILMLAFSNVYWLEWLAVGLFIVYILLIGNRSRTFTKHVLQFGN